MTIYTYDGVFLYADSIVRRTTEHKNCEFKFDFCAPYSKINTRGNRNWVVDVNGNPITAFAVLGSTNYETILASLLESIPGSIRSIMEIITHATDRRQWMHQVNYLFVDASGALSVIENNDDGLVSRTTYGNKTNGRPIMFGINEWVEEWIDNCAIEPISGLEAMVIAQNFHEEGYGRIDALNVKTGELTSVTPTDKERKRIFTNAIRKLKPKYVQRDIPKDIIVQEQ
jgi:hypothetical protein